MAKQSVLQNINEIITVKNELKNILIALGMDPSDNFEEYPQDFTDAIIMINNKANIILGEE
jgi:hypothetical protein